MMKIYSLFSGRHDLPENEGAVCSSFDFATKKVVKTEHWDNAIDQLKNGHSIGLYVTGLTPALTEFLSDAISAQEIYVGYSYGTVILFHYDAETKQYWAQRF